METINLTEDRWTFISSNGIVTTDGNGKVIVNESDLDDYLLDIDKMDILEMSNFAKRIGNSFIYEDEQDILVCGFWKKDGTYQKADEKWRKEMYFVFDENSIKIQ